LDLKLCINYFIKYNFFSISVNQFIQGSLMIEIFYYQSNTFTSWASDRYQANKSIYDMKLIDNKVLKILNKE